MKNNCRKKEKKTHSVMPFLTRAPSPSFWSFAKTFLITCLVTLSESQEADIVMMMEEVVLCILFTYNFHLSACNIYSHRERERCTGSNRTSSCRWRRIGPMDDMGRGPTSMNHVIWYFFLLEMVYDD